MIEEGGERRSFKLLVVGVLGIVLGVAGTFATGISRTSAPTLLAVRATASGPGELTFVTDSGMRGFDPVTGGVTPIQAEGASSDWIAYSWSPDGSKVAFINRAISATPTCSLNILDLKTGSERKVANCPVARTYSYSRQGVDWSEDGSKLVFENGIGIAAVPASGGPVEQVTGPGLPYRGVARSPSWSPDGSSIVFQAARNVMILNADGSQPRLIADGFLPTWSPDGSEIAYLTDEPMVHPTSGDPMILRLVLTNVEGGPSRILADQPGCCIGIEPSIAWSSDGSHLVMSSGRAVIVDAVTGGVESARALAHPLPGSTWRPVVETS